MNITNMYVSYLGSKGALHLVKELINNAIDECTNKNSPGDTIDIYLDETENTVTVTDNGRGIPPESMEIVCTVLQSGSKFERSGSGGSSAGENGVGLTACNSLSDRFEIIVYRYGEKSKIGFVRGKKTDNLTTVSTTKKSKHGTTFILSPSRFFMGDDCDIIANDLIDWLEKIIYLVPSDIKINLGIKKKGKESIVTKKLSNKNGLCDYVKKLCSKPIVDPIHTIDTMKIKEKHREKEFDRFIGLEYAFTYSSSSTEFTTDSFCNFVNTVDNGVHLDAVRTAISQYFQKITKESMSEREANKLDIIFADVTPGMYLVVYLQTDLSPQFTGQTKEKLSNNEFFKPLRDMTYRSLVKYFDQNPKELKKITERIKTNAKARIESTKVRNSVIRGETSNFDEHLMSNFEPANNDAKGSYRELFIVEGLSAKGPSSMGRFDRDTQAIFTLRGVPLNSFGVSLDEVLLNAEFHSLVKILGCNIGERFDITKLRYDKIIIMADSDSDGYNITSMICAFFITHMRELVEKGFIYKAIAPLYRIRSKYKEYILNKKEYIQIFEKQIRGNVKLVNPKTNVVYTDSELNDLLYANRDYLEELERTASHFAIDPLLLEYIIVHDKDSNFYKKFRKKYTELVIDDQNVLSGILNNKYQILILDDLFEKRVKSLRKYVQDTNKSVMYYGVYELHGKETIDKGTMTLGEFLIMCQKFQPPIITRYKGLGELNPDQLRETTLDPNRRMLIRLTSEDIERDLMQFNILHGKKYSHARKQMMRHFKISRDELDN